MATRTGTKCSVPRIREGAEWLLLQNDLVTAREGFHLKNSSGPRELIRPEPRPTQTALRLRISSTGQVIDENHPTEQRRSDSAAAFSAAERHCHDPFCRAACPGSDRSGRGVLALTRGNRDRFERIGAVGISLHHHAGGQHYRKRHRRKDKADKLQAAAICHGHPQSLLTRRDYGRHKVQNALAKNWFRDSRIDDGTTK